uniref:Uncharacterized protein n=1 Tax=viral metagenome TaxID=1070528 RepID=A0A6C0JUZ0_9ZZZZ
MPPSLFLMERNKTRKLKGQLGKSAKRKARREALVMSHRRGTQRSAPVALAPIKIPKKELKKIAMAVDLELRRSARIATRKSNSASAVATAPVSARSASLKKAAKSASAKTVSLLYPSLLSGPAPGVLKSKVDSAWAKYIDQKRRNAGVQRLRVNREPANSELNSLATSLSRTFGDVSTRYAGPKRHHLTEGNERKLAVIAENENENK